MPVKLVALIVLFPLGLACVGGWQLFRVQGDIARFAADDARLESLFQKVAHNFAVIERVRKETGKSDAMLPTSDGKKISAVTAYRNTVRMEKKLSAERRNIQDRLWWLRSVCRFLALAVIALGASGALMGAFGLFTVRQSGIRAFYSREALLSGFRRGLKKLPWIIGSVGLFIALSIAVAVAFELVAFVRNGAEGRLSGKLIITGVMVIGFLIFFGGKLVWNIYRASRAVFGRDPLCLMGKNVSREEAPLVWEFVASVAGRAGATMPDAIVLGLDEGFFVTEHPVALLNGERVPEGRVLYLSLPYLAYMTKPEAEAVVGHELGHFTGADTEYSLKFSPIYAAAVDNLRAVGAAAGGDSDLLGFVARPALMLGVYYLDSFDLAVQHWSREREFAADTMGAAIAGREAVALSLLRISVLGPHVCRALGECWHKGGQLEGGVLNRVRELVREEGLGDPLDYLEEKQAHPTDSHPATCQRLEAVGVAVTPELLAAARGVAESSLLRDLGIEAAADGGCLAGISAALEAEFSLAARQSSDAMKEDLHQAALLGTGCVSFYEDPRWGWGGIAIGCLMVLVGVLAAQRSLLAGTGGIAMGLASLGLFPYYRARSRKPFLVLTGDGFRAGAMAEEIPWTAVRDYGLSTQDAVGMRISVTIAVIFADAYTPPEIKGDRRVKLHKRQHRLYVTVRGIAKPSTIENVAEEFHHHWRGGMARAALENPDA